MTTPAWVILVLFVSWLWIGGALFRAGYLRYMGKPYLSPDTPRPTRHYPIAMIPAACGFTSALVMALLAEFGSTASWFFFLLFVAFVVWTLVVYFRAPEFLKPSWLREEERRQARRPRP